MSVFQCPLLYTIFFAGVRKWAPAPKAQKTQFLFLFHSFLCNSQHFLKEDFIISKYVGTQTEKSLEAAFAGESQARSNGNTSLALREIEAF